MLFVLFLTFQDKAQNPGSAHMGLLNYSPYKQKTQFSLTLCLQGSPSVNGTSKISPEINFYASMSPRNY